MGPAWFFAYAVPTLCLALVAWAVGSRRLRDGPRRATMAATILLACGAWTLVRTEGMSGDHDLTFDWRWTKSREERLLAQAGREPAASAQGGPTALPPAPAAMEVPKAAAAAKADDKSNDAARGKPVALPKAPTAKTEPATLAAVATRAEWPGFRGPERDGISRGVRIETNWSASPPVELWRRTIGPGWSSFAVRADLLYTQEQRGDEEVVACYDAATGKPVWTHRDAVRFFESNGGAGPRGTPTLRDDRVYTFGATGIVNALDAGERRRRVVAQRGVGHWRGGPDLGLLELAAGSRRGRDRRRQRSARRLRPRHRQSALVRSRPAAGATARHI